MYTLKYILEDEVIFTNTKNSIYIAIVFVVITFIATIISAKVENYFISCAFFVLFIYMTTVVVIFFRYISAYKKYSAKCRERVESIELITKILSGLGLKIEHKGIIFSYDSRNDESLLKQRRNLEEELRGYVSPSIPMHVSILNAD